MRGSALDWPAVASLLSRPWSGGALAPLLKAEEEAPLALSSLASSTAMPAAAASPLLPRALLALLCARAPVPPSTICAARELVAVAAGGGGSGWGPVAAGLVALAYPAAAPGFTRGTQCDSGGDGPANDGHSSLLVRAHEASRVLLLPVESAVSRARGTRRGSKSSTCNASDDIVGADGAGASSALAALSLYESPLELRLLPPSARMASDHLFSYFAGAFTPAMAVTASGTSSLAPGQHFAFPPHAAASAAARRQAVLAAAAAGGALLRASCDAAAAAADEAARGDARGEASGSAQARLSAAETAAGQVHSRLQALLRGGTPVPATSGSLLRASASAPVLHGAWAGGDGGSVAVIQPLSHAASDSDLPQQLHAATGGAAVGASSSVGASSGRQFSAHAMAIIAKSYKRRRDDLATLNVSDARRGTGGSGSGSAAGGVGNGVPSSASSPAFEAAESRRFEAAALDSESALESIVSVSSAPAAKRTTAEPPSAVPFVARPAPGTNPPPPANRADIVAKEETLTPEQLRRLAAWSEADLDRALEPLTSAAAAGQASEATAAAVTEGAPLSPSKAAAETRTATSAANAALLLRHLLHPNPEQRCASIDAVLAHPFTSPGDHGGRRMSGWSIMDAASAMPAAAAPPSAPGSPVRATAAAAAAAEAPMSPSTWRGLSDSLLSAVNAFNLGLRTATSAVTTGTEAASPSAQHRHAPAGGSPSFSIGPPPAAMVGPFPRTGLTRLGTAYPAAATAAADRLVHHAAVVPTDADAGVGMGSTYALSGEAGDGDVVAHTLTPVNTRVPAHGTVAATRSLVGVPAVLGGARQPGSPSAAKQE